MTIASFFSRMLMVKSQAMSEGTRTTHTHKNSIMASWAVIQSHSSASFGMILSYSSLYSTCVVHPLTQKQKN
jgi:ADP-ribosylglycohydrolase